MAKRDVQLRMTRPDRRVKIGRLTQRQQALLNVLRWTGAPMTLTEIEQRMSFAHTSTPGRVRAYGQLGSACTRLVKRGLVVRVRRGVYQAGLVRERKV